MVQTRTIVSITAATAVAGLVGYAVYFDHKRRSDPHFRKALKRDSKRTARAAQKADKESKAALTAKIEKAVRDVRKPGVLPSGVEEREQYFMISVGEGEQLFARGPASHFDAAVAFFKALKVYPSPLELVMIYQKAVPAEVFALIMEMIGLDAKLGPEPGSAPVDPRLSQLAAAASGAPTAGAAGNVDEVDDESPAAGAASTTASGATPSTASPSSAPVSSNVSGSGNGADSGADASSQDGRGPPSTYSSQEGGAGNSSGVASGYSSQPEGSAAPSAAGGNGQNSAFSSQEWERVSEAGSFAAPPAASPEGAAQSYNLKGEEEALASPPPGTSNPASDVTATPSTAAPQADAQARDAAADAHASLAAERAAGES